VFSGVAVCICHDLFTRVKLIDLTIVLIQVFALLCRGIVTASFLKKTRRK
jgi:hypothetical protein